MKNTMKTPRILLACLAGAALSAASVSAQTFSDDFERQNDVALTSNGSDIGPNYEIGGQQWGIQNTSTDGFLTNDADAAKRAIWNTSVELPTANGESASVSADVSSDFATGVWNGLAFNVQTLNNDSQESFYWLRFKEGTGDYQLLRNIAGNLSAPINETANSTFTAGTFFTVSADVSINQDSDPVIHFEIADGNTTIVSGTFTDTSADALSGGFTGFANGSVDGSPLSGGELRYDNLAVVPESSYSSAALGLAALALAMIAARGRRRG